MFCVYVNENGSLVSGGGKDNAIKVWDLKNKEASSSVEVKSALIVLLYNV